MSQNKTLAAQQKDAVFQASIDFIATLTGMQAPPIEVAPPEVFAPFREFSGRVCAIFERAVVDLAAATEDREALAIDRVPKAFVEDAPVGDAVMPVIGRVHVSACGTPWVCWLQAPVAQAGIVRQSDALTALAAKDAEIARLESAWQVDTMRRKDGVIAAQEAQNDKLRAELAAMTDERDTLLQAARKTVLTLAHIISHSKNGALYEDAYAELNAAIDKVKQ